MADRVYSVAITGDASPYVRELNRSAQQTTTWAGQVERAGARAGGGLERAGNQGQVGFSRAAVAAQLMRGNVQGIAQAATGFLAGGVLIRGLEALGRGITGVVMGGANLNETLSKTGEVFGPSAGAVIQSADQIGDRFGVLEQEFLDTASALGLIFAGANLAQGPAASLSVQLGNLAADAVSFYNVPLPEVLMAIRSGLVGEAEPMRRFGVLLNEDAVQAEALRLGLAGANQELNDGQKVVARASLIVQGLGTASGDLARTQDSLANRLRGVRGHIINWAADMGNRARPQLERLLDVSYELGQRGLAVLEDAVDRLGPFLSGAADAGRNLWEILGEIAGVVGPVVAGFGAIAGIGIIEMLNMLASTVSAVTGFLADHEQIVQVLAVLYASRFVTAIGQATVALVQMTRVQVATWLLTLQANAFAAGGAMGLLRAAMSALPAVALTAGIFAYASALQKAKDNAQDLIGEITRNVDRTSVDSMREGIRDLQVAIDEQRSGLSGYEGAWGAVRAGVGNVIQVLTPLENKILDTHAAMGALSKEEEVLAGLAINLEGNINELRNQFGLTEEQIRAVANAAGVDLTDDFQSVVPPLREVIEGLFSGGRAALDMAGGLNLSSSELAALGLNATALAQSLLEVKGVFDSISAPGLGDFMRLSDQREKAAVKAAKSEESAAEKAVKMERALIGVERAQMRLRDSQEELTRARDSAARNEAVVEAEGALEAAYRDTVRAAFAVLDAERALEDARRARETGRTVQEAEFALQRAYEAVQAAAEEARIAELKLFAAQDHGTPEEISQSNRELNEAYRRQAETAWNLQDAQVALTRARQDAGGGRQEVLAALDLAEAHRGVTDAQRDELRAAEELVKARSDTGARELEEAELALREALLGVREANLQVAESHEKAAGGAAQIKTATDIATESLRGFIKVMEENLTAANNWERNLILAAQRGGAGVAAAFNKLGPEYAAVLQQLVTATDRDFNKAADLAIAGAVRETEGYKVIIRMGLGDAEAIAAFQSGAVAESIARELGVQVPEVKRIMEQYFVSVIGPLNALMLSIGRTPLAPGSKYTLDDLAKYATYAKGGVDAHVVHQPTVLYGERETGGEAFVPKRGISQDRAASILGTAAGWHGLQVVPMARGGTLVTIPYPPTGLEQRYGFGLGRSADQTGDFTYETLTQFARERGGGLGAGGGGGYGGGGIVAVAHMLEQLFGVRISEHPAFGGVDPVHTRNSYHYKGRAIDVNYYPASREPGVLDAVAAWIRGNVDPVTELLWRTKGHYNHLHLAMARGGINPAQSFDGGGWLQPGWTAAYNGTGRPEMVGGGVIVNIRMDGMIRQTISAAVDASAVADVTRLVVEPVVDKLRREIVDEVMVR